LQRLRGGASWLIPIEARLLGDGGFLEHAGKLLSKIVHIITEFNDRNDAFNLIVNLLTCPNSFDHATDPNQLRVGDITCIRIAAGFVYLARAPVARLPQGRATQCSAVVDSRIIP